MERSTDRQIHLVSVSPSSKIAHVDPDTAAPALAPVIAADEVITPGLDRALTALAVTATAGDLAATHALYAALVPKIDRFSGRYRRGWWADVAGRAWEPGDVSQEAYLVFAELLELWEEGPSFSAYFFSHFPWRLNRAMRRLHGPRFAPFRLNGFDALVDGSYDAVEAMELVAEMAATLPQPERQIFLWRVRDRLPFGVIARRLDLSRRTVLRRWQRLTAELSVTPQRASEPRQTEAATTEHSAIISEVARRGRD